VYSLRNIIRMIRSRTIKWAGHVACMGETNNGCRILMGRQKERDH
jgi:hypothetical protein